ncbi:hypothetical protein ACFE04_024700 [Oxalis oulophora]
MRNQMIIMVVVMVGVIAGGKGSVKGADLSSECADSINKLTTCLTFATGKAVTPTKECCTSVKTIKDSEPKCLCYIIQQTHNGSDAIKSLGIQQDKLIQLQPACQLQNASISYCPKLLGLAPGSADAAIFSNSSSSSSTTTTSPAAPATTSAPDKANGYSITNGPYHIIGIIAMAVIILCGFPIAGSASI